MVTITYLYLYPNLAKRVKKKVAEKSPSNRDKLLSTYATAQSYLGVEITLKAKALVVGEESLNSCSLAKFNKLIKELRRLYKIRSFGT